MINIKSSTQIADFVTACVLKNMRLRQFIIREMQKMKQIRQKFIPFYFITSDNSSIRVMFLNENL
jgi:hypothetical protein